MVRRLCLLALVSTACGKSDAPKPPLTLAWADRGNFSLAGDRAVNVKGEVGYNGPYAARLAIENAPAGLTARFGDVAVTTFPAELPLRPYLGQAPVPSQLDAAIPVDLGTLTLTLADGRTASAPIPKLSYTALVQMPTLFEGVKEGAPLQFIGEPTAGKPDAALTESTVIGEAKIAQDIDWIVLVPLGDYVSSLQCAYTDEDPKQNETITVKFHKVNATIIDRRTGKVIDRATFDPMIKCPGYLIRKETEAGKDYVTGYSSFDIEKWVRERFAK